MAILAENSSGAATLAGASGTPWGNTVAARHGYWMGSSLGDRVAYNDWF